MALLLRKLLRDLRRQGWQAFAVVLVMTLGLALYVTSAASYLDLRDSYAAVQEELRLADLTVSARPFGTAELEAARGLPGIARAEGRWVVEWPIVLPSTPSLQVAGRLIGLEAGRNPPIDRLLVTGRLPAATGEILVEKHFAAFHHLRPGARLTLEAPGAGIVPLRVTGIAVSPEYLWVSRSRSDPMPTPSEFGVFWALRSDLLTIGQRAARTVPSPAGTGRFNELLCRLVPGTSAKDVQGAVEGVLGPATFLARRDMPGLALLQMDLDGLKGMAVFFPLGFLIVAGFVAGAVQGRLIDAQRTVIGTFLALGMRRREVLGHYLGLAFLPGAAGTLLGLLLGVVGSAELANEYALELGIPEVTVHFQSGVVWTGLAAGWLVALVAGLPGAWRASRLAPAEAMRSAPARRLPHLLMASRSFTRRLPLALAMPLRNLMRRPFRALLTALGIACATVLVLVTGATVDGTESAFHAQLDRSERYDLRADLYQVRPQAELARQGAGLPGVRSAEVALTLPVELTAGSARREAVLEGLAAGADLMRTVDFSGRRVEPDPGGIVVARALARRLKTVPGDWVHVRSLLDGREARLRVSGLSDSPMGGGVSMRLADAGRVFGLEGQANTVLVSCEPSRRATVRSALQDWSNVVRIQDRGAFRQLVAQLTGLAFAMVGTMLVFASVLAAAILFNTATITVLERTREYATLRALGMPLRTLGSALVVEHGLLAALALAMGLPAGSWLAVRALALFDGDLFSLPFALSARTLSVSVLGVLLVLWLALWPNLRAIARTDLAQAVRGREGQ